MADGKKVVLYTTEPCGFCRQAKALLQSRGIAFDQTAASMDGQGVRR